MSRGVLYHRRRRWGIADTTHHTQEEDSDVRHAPFVGGHVDGCRQVDACAARRPGADARAVELGLGRHLYHQRMPGRVRIHFGRLMERLRQPHGGQRQEHLSRDDHQRLHWRQCRLLDLGKRHLRRHADHAGRHRHHDQPRHRQLGGRSQRQLCVRVRGRDRSGQRHRQRAVVRALLGKRLRSHELGEHVGAALRYDQHVAVWRLRRLVAVLVHRIASRAV